MKQTEQTAALFTNGGSQAVRLPAQFRFEGAKVGIRRDPETGDVILSRHSTRQENWDKFLEARAEVRPEDIPDGWPFRDTEPATFRDPFESWAEPK